MLPRARVGTRSAGWLDALLRGLALSAVAGLLVGSNGALSPTLAHADGEVTVSVAPPDDSAFPVVTFVMTADRDGRPLRDLAPSDLRVREHGVVADVTSVRRAQDGGMPLALVITVDTSGSMAGASIEQAKASANALVERLSAQDAVGVVAFSDHATTVQRVSTDRAPAARSIANLVAQGNTALYDAVSESVRAVSASGQPRRAVVMLSDGREFGGASTTSREESLDRAARGGAVFYVIGVGADIDVAYLQEVATRTGGRFFQASGPGDVPQVYAALEEVLRTEFVVTLNSRASAAGAERWLEVEVIGAQGQGSRARPYDSRRPPAQTLTPAAPSNVRTGSESQALAPAGSQSSWWAGLLLDASWPALPGITGWTLWISVGSVLGLLVGGVTALLVARQRRSRRRPVQMRSLWRGAGVVGVDPAARQTQPGDVVLRVSSGSATGMALPLPDGPVDIGWAEGCGVRLEPASGVAERHARIAWRDGHASIRHLAPGFETRVNGRVIEAAPLDLGYEITIGPALRLRVEASPRAGTASGRMTNRARRVA